MARTFVTMIWLQSPPWGKWIATGLVVCVAFWFEVKPDPNVEHPFALASIAAGEAITTLNTELRPVPAGLFEPIDGSPTAISEIEEGDPILASNTGAADSLVPPGWWVVAADLPRAASVGDRVQLVLLDSGVVVAGVVADRSSDDPFDTAKGGIAVEPSQAAEVARASAEGRIAVLVATG